MDENPIRKSDVSADFATHRSYVVGPSRVSALSDPLRIENARAAINIANWMTYLPSECVKAMVKCGWHRIVVTLLASLGGMIWQTRASICSRTDRLPVDRSECVSTDLGPFDGYVGERPVREPC